MNRWVTSILFSVSLVVGASGCGVETAGGEETTVAAESLRAGTAPVTATILEGQGAAGARLGMTQAEVAAVLGTGTCNQVSATRNQSCTYASADGIARAIAVFDTGAPRRLITLTAPFGNATWKTTKGIHGGSSSSDLTAAYGAAIDASRSSYYSKAVPGVDSAGQPSVTRFTLGWINEYQPDQYFGVVSITVGRL